VTRLYPILDATALGLRNIPMPTAARAFLEAGAGILQIRNKDHWTRMFYEEARVVAGLCSQYGSQLIVNDRADFALLLGAGLHVGQDDLPPSAARDLIGETQVLGFSTHHSDQLAAAAEQPVSYVALGPIFSTYSKDRPDPEVGLDNLRNWRKLAAKLPLVAIGGITRKNALSVLDAGADSVAVIGDLLPADATEISLSRRFEEWLRLIS
jgi:thiamine-phosphate pyrophosphorylase